MRQQADTTEGGLLEDNSVHLRRTNIYLDKKEKELLLLHLILSYHI